MHVAAVCHVLLVCIYFCKRILIRNMISSAVVDFIWTTDVKKRHVVGVLCYNILAYKDFCYKDFHMRSI